MMKTMFVLQDVSAERSLKSPELYKCGLNPKLPIHVKLLLCLLFAVYTSLVLFFIPFGVFHNTAYDFQTMAVTVSMAATFIATTEVRMYLFKNN